MYVQVKSNRSDFYKARKAIAEWMAEYGLSIDAQVWLYEGRGEWRCEQIS